MRIHSWLSEKCRVIPSTVEGTGVVAISPIAEGELVAVWGGKIYTSAEIEELGQHHKRFRKAAVSIAPNLLLGGFTVHDDTDDTENLNHSCDPNVGVVGQVVLVARRSIGVGEELTFDYDTVETADTPFECRCGARECRRIIAGSSWKNPAFRQAHAGYLSWNVQEAIRRAERGEQAD